MFFYCHCTWFAHHVKSPNESKNHFLLYSPVFCQFLSVRYVQSLKFSTFVSNRNRLVRSGPVRIRNLDSVQWDARKYCVHKIIFHALFEWAIFARTQYHFSNLQFNNFSFFSCDTLALTLYAPAKYCTHTQLNERSHMRPAAVRSFLMDLTSISRITLGKFL